MYISDLHVHGWLLLSGAISPLYVVQVLGQFTDDNIMNYDRHGTSLGLGTKACC